jgi:hypothetical protein
MGGGRRGLVVLRPFPDALLAGSARGGELVEIGTVRLTGTRFAVQLLCNLELVGRGPLKSRASSPWAECGRLGL